MWSLRSGSLTERKQGSHRTRPETFASSIKCRAHERSLQRFRCRRDGNIASLIHRCLRLSWKCGFPCRSAKREAMGSNRPKLPYFENFGFPTPGNNSTKLPASEKRNGACFDRLVSPKQQTQNHCIAGSFVIFSTRIGNVCKTPEQFSMFQFPFL